MDDIKTKEDIAHLVNTFYQKVQDDQLIGPVFASKIRAKKWPVHLERMTSFWSTVLLNKSDYKGNPFAHHIKLGIDQRHFDCWIKLFTETVKANFEGPKAVETIDRAKRMRTLFEAKLKHISANPNQHPIL